MVRKDISEDEKIPLVSGCSNGDPTVSSHQLKKIIRFQYQGIIQDHKNTASAVKLKGAMYNAS